MTVYHSLGDLWSVMSQVQRAGLLERARVDASTWAEHAQKDWVALPPQVAAQLAAVR